MNNTDIINNYENITKTKIVNYYTSTCNQYIRIKTIEKKEGNNKYLADTIYIINEIIKRIKKRKKYNKPDDWINFKHGEFDIDVNSKYVEIIYSMIENGIYNMQILCQLINIDGLIYFSDEIYDKLLNYINTQLDKYEKMFKEWFSNQKMYTSQRYCNEIKNMLNNIKIDIKKEIKGYRIKITSISDLNNKIYNTKTSCIIYFNNLYFVHNRTIIREHYIDDIKENYVINKENNNIIASTLVEIDCPNLRNKISSVNTCYTEFECTGKTIIKSVPFNVVVRNGDVLLGVDNAIIWIRNSINNYIFESLCFKNENNNYYVKKVKINNLEIKDSSILNTIEIDINSTIG